MSDWKRQTKEVSLESLPPEIASAMQQHVERYNLGPILAEALMCIRTDSEKTRKGLFGKPEIVKLVAIVTPLWLVWSIEQPNTKPAVLSAQLAHVTIQDYAHTPFVEMIHDSGIQVTGMFTDAGESASAFIGLDESDIGNKFKEIVIRAAQASKK